jgi:hypothetical protein
MQVDRVTVFVKKERLYQGSKQDVIQGDCLVPGGRSDFVKNADFVVE